MRSSRRRIGQSGVARVRSALGMTLVFATLSFVLAVPQAQAAVKIDEFGTPSANSGPVGIAIGSDGNLWFTEYNALNIGQLTPSKVPVFNYEFPVTAGNPGIMVPGSDGNLWFIETCSSCTGESIGRITPSGTVTEFPLTDPSAQLDDITPGPDGNLWSAQTGFAFGSVNRITTSGIMTNFAAPDMEGITAGPDGNSG